MQLRRPVCSAGWSKNCKLWASATADTLQWSVTGYQTFWSYAV